MPEMSEDEARTEMMRMAMLAEKGMMMPEKLDLKQIDGEWVQPYKVNETYYEGNPTIYRPEWCTKLPPDSDKRDASRYFLCNIPLDGNGGTSNPAGSAEKSGDAKDTASAPTKPEMGWWDHGYHLADVVGSFLPVWPALMALRDYKEEADQPGHEMDGWDHAYHVADFAFGCIPVAGALWSVPTAIRDWYVDASDSGEEDSVEKTEEGAKKDSGEAPKEAALGRPGDAPAASASGSASPSAQDAAAAAIGSAAPAKPVASAEQYGGGQSLTVLVLKDDRGQEVINEQLLKSQLDKEGWFHKLLPDVQKKIFDYARDHAMAHADPGQSVQWNMNHFYAACYDRFPGEIKRAKPNEEHRNRGPKVVWSMAGEGHKSAEIVMDKDKKEKSDVGVDIPNTAAAAGGGKGNGAASAKKGGGNPFKKHNN
jgi:hypothetical protein